MARPLPRRPDRNVVRRSRMTASRTSRSAGVISRTSRTTVTSTRTSTTSRARRSSARTPSIRTPRSRPSRRRPPIQSKLGPASFSLGATRKQYPGRDQVDQTFPTLSLTSTAISLGDHFSWTPGFSFSRSDVLHIDQPGLGAYHFVTDPATGIADTVRSTGRNSASTSASFDTPVQIFGYTLRNSFRVTQQRNNFPQQFDIYDVHTGAVTDTRVFAATYYTYVDWNPELHAAVAGAQPVQPHTERELAERRPGPVLGGDRADEREVRQPVQATHVERSQCLADIVCAVPRLRAVLAHPPFDQSDDQLLLCARGAGERRVSRGIGPVAKGLPRQPRAERGHIRADAEFRGEGPHASRLDGKREGGDHPAAEHQHDADDV